MILLGLKWLKHAVHNPVKIGLEKYHDFLTSKQLKSASNLLKKKNLSNVHVTTGLKSGSKISVKEPRKYHDFLTF